MPVGEKLGENVATLLFDLSRFHQREDKPAYWAIFDRLAQDSEDLLDDLECLQGLEATGAAIKDKRSFQREYRFPEQETKLRVGKTPCVKPATMPEGINLVALDEEARTVVLRRSTAKGPLPDRLDLLPPRPIDNRIVRKAMASTTERIIAADPRASAIVDLLTKAHPRIDCVEPGVAIVAEGRELVEGAVEAIGAMRDTVLAIQGPPGTGKTYVSAKAIVALVRTGRRVAVSSRTPVY